MGNCSSCASDRKEDDDDNSTKVEEASRPQGNESPKVRQSYFPINIKASQVVKLELTIANLDYDQLVANSTLVNLTIASIRAAVALEAGPDIQPTDVCVELRSGSVKANIRVGDTVQLSAEGQKVQSDYDWSNDPLAPGDEGTIVKIDDASGQCLVRGPSGRENWYEEKDIVSAHKANFRVNDYVKLSSEGRNVASGYDWSKDPLAPGTLARIAKVDDASGQSLVCGPMGDENWYAAKDIELADKAQVIITPPTGVDSNEVANRMRGSSALTVNVTAGMAEVPGIQAVASGGEIFAILTSEPEIVDEHLPAEQKVPTCPSSASTSADSGADGLPVPPAAVQMSKQATIEHRLDSPNHSPRLAPGTPPVALDRRFSLERQEDNFERMTRASLAAPIQVNGVTIHDVASRRGSLQSSNTENTDKDEAHSLEASYTALGGDGQAVAQQEGES